MVILVEQFNMRGEKLKRVASLVAFPLFIAATIVVVIVFRKSLWEIFSSPEKIQQTIDNWGIKAPLTFILLQFVQVVIFVIPGEIIQIAGGYLFGLWQGIFLSVIGIALGSAFNFYLARLLGVPFVKHLFKDEQRLKFEAISHSARAQIAFFLLFVIPGIPKDVLCYVAGLSPLKFGAFLLISAIGRLPGIIGSAAMGEAAAMQRWILAIGILVGATILFVLGLIFKEKVHIFVEKFALSKNPPAKPGDTKDDADSEKS